MRSGERAINELLVLDCQAGSDDALQQLAERWHARLLYCAMSLVGDRDGAMEVAQEAWLAIVRGIGGLKDPARFPPWSQRIVQNKAADWIRRNQRRRATEIADGVEPVDSADAGLDNSDSTAPDLRAAIRMLSPTHRRVIDLYYLEELSIAEVARLISTPVGTVKSRLFHAREQLRKTLEERQ